MILFLLASIGITWVSRSSLRDTKSHGFYRYFAWEIILILFLINMDYWFLDPFSLSQVISWSCLIISLVLVIQGVQTLRKKGGIDAKRQDSKLIGVEKTTELVTSGLYGYIRHPFYSSLFFLGWGIFFKHLSWIGFTLAAINTTLLVITARKEEIENIQYFGETYRDYMKQTKMFIPFIF